MKGKLLELARNYKSGDWIASFSVQSDDIAKIYQDLENQEVDIEIKKYRKKRSKNANALLWECLGKMAAALQTDAWTLYLHMLKRYGQYTYIVARERAVEAIKAQWREVEVVGEIDIHGEKSVQLLCFYGSHTYDTKEFARLLDGVISEMKEIGLPTPESEEIERLLKEWERGRQGRTEAKD